MRIKLNLTFVVVLIAVLSSGCVTTAATKISQFDSFATAGKTYTAAMDGLLVEAGQVLVDTNSKKLIWTKADFPDVPNAGDQLTTSLTGADEVVKENLEEMRLLRDQVSLLSAYFDQLAAMATSDAPQAFAKQLEGTATALNSVKEKLTREPDVVGQIAGQIGFLVVRGIQHKELEKELQARKDTIESVLESHQKLLLVLKAQIEADLDIVRQNEYETEVIEPFAASKKLANPDSWSKKRRELLQPVALTEKMRATVGALNKMRTAWAKLLTNSLTAEDVQGIADDLQPVLTGLAALKSD